MSKTHKDGKNRFKVRRFWGDMSPVTRVKQSDKIYSRNNKNWRKELQSCEF